MSFRIPADEPDSPLLIAGRLMRLPEFQHLVDGEATIDWLMRGIPETEAGRTTLGRVHMPMVQGRLRACFEWLLEEKLGRFPDFLIILCDTYWQDATPRQREILVYHELMHCVQKKDAYGTPKFTRDGTPQWGLRGHDIEEFNAVVARYGVHSEDLEAFFLAAGENRDDMMHRPAGEPDHPPDRRLDS